MKIRIDDSNTLRGSTFTELTITTDDAREVMVSAEHSHCYADFESDNDTPLTVGKFQIKPTKIADLAMCGDITTKGDELDVTEAWLVGAGYDGNTD